MQASLRALVVLFGMLALLAVPCGCATDTRTAQWDAAEFAAWRAHLQPSESELAWESLPWLTSYADGVLAAQEQRRPLLLWVMNGHPLGCT